MIDEITDIVKKRGKYYVTINEDHTIMVPYSLLQERPLAVGETVDLAEYENWLMVHQYRHALEKAVSYLAIRARAIKEIEDKLLQYGYLPATVEMVIFKLSKEKLLNDEDFAAQWVKSRAGKSLGNRRIAMELMQKGIHRDTINEALSTVEEEDEFAGALRLAEKLWPRYAKEGSPKGVQKCLQAMVRRGFDWDTAKKAVNQAIDSFENESF